MVFILRPFLVLVLWRVHENSKALPIDNMYIQQNKRNYTSPALTTPAAMLNYESHTNCTFGDNCFCLML